MARINDKVAFLAKVFLTATRKARRIITKHPDLGDFLPFLSDLDTAIHSLKEALTKIRERFAKDLGDQAALEVFPKIPGEHKLFSAFKDLFDLEEMTLPLEPDQDYHFDF